MTELQRAFDVIIREIDSPITTVKSIVMNKKIKNALFGKEMEPNTCHWLSCVDDSPWEDTNIRIFDTSAQNLQFIVEYT